MRLTDRLVPVLLIIAAVMFARAPFLIDAAPQEAAMGLVQKIFYFHLPAAITMFLAAFVCGTASVWYLWRRAARADHLALAAAELAVLFGAMVLVTGPLWARKAWGHWWEWDARLTMSLVMWMIFVAYLLLRRFAGPGSELLASIVGIFGMAIVPFVYLSVRLWRTIHPTTDVVATLPPSMAGPLRWTLLSFFTLFAILLLVRTRLEALRAGLDERLAASEDR